MLDALRTAKRRLSGAAIPVVLGLLLLSACGGSAPATGATAASGATNAPAAATASAAAKPSVYGGTLVVGYASEPSSLAPWRNGDSTAYYIYGAMYDTLVAQTADMQIKPALATSWDVSPDGTQWTFHLSQGVKFWDGTSVDANAVKFNVDLWTTNLPKGGINGISIITGDKVLDPNTIQITTKSPDNQLLTQLASPLHGILSPQAVTKDGENFGHNPVASGPYMFDNWVTGSTVTLKRNPHYWMKDSAGNQLPYLDEIQYKLIQDPQVTNTALLSGTIGLDTTPAPQFVPSLKTNSSVNVYNSSGMGWLGIRLNTGKAPLDNVAVRQALAWATDESQISQLAFNGLDPPAYSFYSPPTPGYDASLKPYTPTDIAKAKQLLAQAGVANGFPLTVVVGSPTLNSMVTVVQAQWAQIGVKVNIQQAERGTFLDGIVKRQWQAYADGILGRADPSQYWDSLMCGAAYDGSNYCNAQFDASYNDGLTKFSDVSDPKRIALYDQMNSVAMHDLPILPLVYPSNIMAWSTKYTGIVVTPPGRLILLNARQAQ